MLNIYKGINRKEYGTESENARLDKLFDNEALIISHATLAMASRASCMDDVIDRSAAISNKVFVLFRIVSNKISFTHFSN